MKEDILDKIDDYLLGKMSESDKNAFEKEMAEDEELATDVAIQKMQHRAWQLAERDNLRSEMTEWKKQKTTELTVASTTESKKSGAKIVSMSRRIYQLAAAAAVLLVIGFAANWAFFSIPSDGDIARQFYEEPSFGTKGAGSGTPLDEAIQLIEKQNYVDAIKILETINDPSLNVQRLFLLSHCYFKKADYASSIVALKTIQSTTTDPLSIQQAEWKIVLTKLTAGQKDDEFKTVLKKISNDPTHTYQAKAMEMSKALKL